MKEETKYKTAQFLVDYPGMAIVPSRGSSLVLKGTFSFVARPPGGIEISDDYNLNIIVPPSFPIEVPRVEETGNKIPRDNNHHVNLDGTLCLGSPIRLRKKVFNDSTLVGFAENCLIPYLYAVSHKLLYGGNFCFGELAHNAPGVIDDYKTLFHVADELQVIRILELLGMKRRIANKQACPCGCKQRLGRCNFNLRLKSYRKIASRAWFKKHARELNKD